MTFVNSDHQDQPTPEPGEASRITDLNRATAADERTDVVVIGAGMAGLVCAADLARAGIHATVLDAADGVGGRVRTDRVDGYLLDRGFQILLTAYPQLRRLDLPALGLGEFAPGALVRTETGTHRISDPLRRPQELATTLRAPVGTLVDKARVGRLILDVRTTAPGELLRRADKSTAQRLADAGFSYAFVRAFWRPFFAGIQLDPDLEVSARRFDITLRMLAIGATGLPRDGIGAVPQQIAAAIPQETVRLHTTAAEVSPGVVTLSDGKRLRARAIVVATDGPAAHELLGSRVPDPGSRPVAACWYSLPRAPVTGPFLLLDGTGAGPAVNVVISSEVQPSYAPAGRASIVAAVPGDAAFDPNLGARVTEQLARWFELSPHELDLLRIDRIAHGQPLQTPPLAIRRRVDLGNGVFVCGDHRDTASLQGAMFSGERTARAVRAHLDRQPPA